MEEAEAAAKPKPYRVEYAKSARSSCKGCKQSIAKEVLRIAKVVQSSKFDGVMTLWFHKGCLLSKPGVIKSLGDLEGLDSLRWEDQQALRSYIENPAAASPAGTSGSGKAKKGPKGAEGDGSGGKRGKKAEGGGEGAGDDGGGGDGEFQVEYAKSSRSTCRGCEEKIDKGEVRIAKMVDGPQGFSVPAWRHARCMLAMGWWTRPLPELPGWDGLSSEDQKALVAMAKGGGTGGKPVGGNSASAAAPAVKGEAGKGKGGTAGGKGTGAKGKGREDEVDAGGQGRPAAGKKRKAAEGKEGIPEERKKVKAEAGSSTPVKTKAKAASANAKDGKGTAKAEPSENADRKPQKPPASDGAKASAAKAKDVKADVAAAARPSPTTAASPGTKASGGASGGNSSSSKSASGPTPTGTTRQEAQLEAQTRKLWEIKDALKRHVATAQLREMLAANKQDTSGSEDVLRDRCADGLMFGPLPPCPMCAAPLEYRDAAYRCRGHLSAWSQCSYSSRDLDRGQGAKGWVIPEPITTTFTEWFRKDEKQWRGKPGSLISAHRVLPPPPPAPTTKPAGRAGTGAADGARERRAKREAEEAALPEEGKRMLKPFTGLRIAILGRLSQPQNSWKEKIDAAGGLLVADISAGPDCAVVSEASIERLLGKLQQARSLGIPIVSEKYLADCTTTGTRRRMAAYALTLPEGINQLVEAEAGAGVGGQRAKVKVKGRGAVHEDSGLQDTCHVLDTGESLYSTTLNRTDLTTGVNSYYILQLLEEDKAKKYHLFRKWGRVGNAGIGDMMLQEMPRDAAVAEFKRLFWEKTGNNWEQWCGRKGVEKKPGKFFPLDIDYGTKEDLIPLTKLTGQRSRLPPRLVELMLMIFDVNAFQAAMLEFEINLSEMPLGKLTKRHVEQGFSVLTDIQNAIQLPDDSNGMKESALRDASNRLFTLIPAVHPHIIRTMDALKEKVRMLESLRDIEIASSILSSSESAQDGKKEGDSGEPEDLVDRYYRQLRCKLEPLEYSSPDYELAKVYLQQTHAPSHKDWDLEVLDVFAVRREGEDKRFATNINNHMLLWHGSRNSNFVGILSQGLRIAPPEAPVTGYMFGKGVYFADLVSKSAQYCYPQRDTPVGLMLLSRVALGSTYDLRQAQFIEKLPKGRDSVKGLGRMKPDDAEFRKWRNDVTVPCGKPVPSGVRSTELNYNEYIVYDTNQVQLEFLLKVKFHHKRGSKSA